MKKILIVSYYWPPSGGPGVQRVLKFVKYLPQFGWQPLVLTVEEGDYPALDESLLVQIPPECKVYKTAVLEPHGLYRKFTGKAKDEKLPTFILNRRKTEGLTQKVARWMRANLFIPDARIGWLPFALREGLKIIEAENIDLIFATSPPHTVQLIAKALARKSGRKWVADFRDPWTEAFWIADLPRSSLSQKIDLWLEKSVLKRAAAVTTVSEGIGALFSAKTDNDYITIQNGFEWLSPETDPARQFILLFIGHLSGYQNPQTFFAALESLPEEIRSRLKMIFVGRIFEGFAELFARYRHLDIETLDYMPYASLMKFARQASILLRPIARSAYAGTSIGAKTADYLALRKPVLALGERNSISERILTETASGRLFEYGDVAGVAQFIKDQFECWQKDGYILLKNEELLKPYTTEENVKKLVRLFDDLTG